MVDPAFHFEMISDYDPYNTEEILQGLNTVKVIATPSPQPAFWQDDELVKKALNITSVALKHFTTIDIRAQKSLVEIFSLLTQDQIPKKLEHEKCKANYNKVVKCFCDSKEISKSICTISSLLTPAREFMTIDQNTSDRCCILVKFAIRFFDLLDSVRQENLVETKRLTLIAQPQHLFLDQDKKNFYFAILETFISFKAEDKEIKQPGDAIPKPAVAKWKEPQMPPTKSKDAVDKFVDLVSEEYGNASAIISYTEIPRQNNSMMERSYKAFMEPREKVKHEQIALISRLFEGIIQHYVPYILQCPKESPLYLLRGTINRLFKKRFPKTALQAFFQEPRNISARETKLICAIFGKVTEFFQDLNKYRPPADANLSLEIEQREIIKRINAQRKLQNKPIIIPDDLDRSVAYENLFKQAQELVLNMCKTENSSLEREIDIPGLLVLLLVLECFDRGFAPYTFTIIIDRLLDDEMDLTNPEKSLKSPSTEHFDASNKNFSETIGSIVVLLANEIINMGNPTGVTGAVANLLMFVIKQLKMTIGEKIQKTLNELTNSECTILPILFAHHILFRKNKDGEYEPTLLDQFKKDKDQQAAFQQSVEHRLFDRLYPLIEEAVRKKSTAGAFVMGNTGSLKEFCQTLIKALWRLTQQDGLLKLLLIYLLEGINEAIVTQK